MAYLWCPQAPLLGEIKTCPHKFFFRIFNFEQFLFDAIFSTIYFLQPSALNCPAKEKWRNSKIFQNRVHGSTRMFRVYSIIILCENAAIKRTVLPKVVKQNYVSHYFWKKLSKLGLSQNTRKKWRISIKVDEIRLFCLAF